MAKKPHRGRKQKRQTRLSPAQMVQPGESWRQHTAGETSKAGKAREVDLKKEYRYVISDLKRIAILAAAMLAILIVLAAVLA